MVNAAANHILRSDRCVPKNSGIVFTRRTYLGSVYETELLKNRIFSIKEILKHKQVACMRKKNSLLFSSIIFYSRDIQVFKICKLAKWWRQTLNQILIKYDEKRYLRKFVSEMFDSL